jgi:hypothetical protein
MYQESVIDRMLVGVDRQLDIFENKLLTLRQTLWDKCIAKEMKKQFKQHKTVEINLKTIENQVKEVVNKIELLKESQTSSYCSPPKEEVLEDKPFIVPYCKNEAIIVTNRKGHQALYINGELAEIGSVTTLKDGATREAPSKLGKDNPSWLLQAAEHYQFSSMTLNHIKIKTRDSKRFPFFVESLAIFDEEKTYL